jgi:4-amino-4-deoxy-L-arabinose transferase-like glycosyltransferase
LPSDDPQAGLDRGALRMIFAACATLLPGYLVYSQTMAFHWDEGFHLLAAHLINAGRTPYVDFCFPQAPLNAYWNAAWMRIFGDSWRGTHVIAALLTLGAAALIARFLFTRFPDAGWRFFAAFSAILLFTLNMLVLQFGALAQAYAFSMFMIAAALVASAGAVERERWSMAAIAGFFAAAAVSATMLAAAAGPVFLVWILIYSQRGSRLKKFAGFAAGALVAFAPIIFLFVKGPRQTWFNLVQYHVAYRRVEWPGATVHDVDTLTSWVDHSQGLILSLLVVAGVVFWWRKSSRGPSHGSSLATVDSVLMWDRNERGPFVLCAWVMLAVGIQNGFAHPTFSQYFVPMIPAATILATLGLYRLAIRLDVLERPAKLIGALGLIFLVSTLRGLFDNRDDFTWRKVERAAQKVEEVTPKGATLLGAEQIYFLTHRPPPEGMEFDFSHKLDFGPERNALLHILPRKELERRISARAYFTDAVCDDSDEVDRVDGLGIYAQKADLGECTIFWAFKPAAAPGSPPIPPSLKGAPPEPAPASSHGKASTGGK